MIKGTTASLPSARGISPVVLQYLGSATAAGRKGDYLHTGLHASARKTHVLFHTLTRSGQAR